MQNIYIKNIKTQSLTSVFLGIILTVFLSVGVFGIGNPVKADPTNSNTNSKTNTNANTNTTKPNNTSTSTSVKIPQIDNPFGPAADTIPGVINRVINVLLALIIIAAVIVIVISGFRMVVGGSNPEQLKKAKTGIIWAIIGIVVALMSFAIVQIIQQIL